MSEKLYNMMDWPEIEAVVYSEENEPKKILGPRVTPEGILIQCFLPGAAQAKILTTKDRKEYEMELEVTDAHVLLEQLIGEHVAWLTERGWQVDVHPLGGSALIEVDTVCMKRLFDNLFSNIEKYADSARPVVIRQWVAEEKLYVTLSNQISQSSGQVESTNIGLKTCERILQLMGGTFRTCRMEETFRAEAVLPLYREAEEMAALPAGDP